MATFQYGSSSSVIEVTPGTWVVAVAETYYGESAKVILCAEEAEFVIEELGKFIQKSKDREKAWE